MADVLSGGRKNLRGRRRVMMRVSAVAQAARKPGTLEVKTAERVALAIPAAARCDDGAAFPAKAAVECGAFRDGMLETLGMAIYMGASPSAM